MKAFTTYSTFFKTVGNTKPLPFSKTPCNGFNFVDFYPGRYPNNNAILSKRMEDSYQLDILVDKNYQQNLRELRLTNSAILTWEDYWIDDSNNLAEPKLEIINLQKNALIHANFNLTRMYLQRLNLEDNPPLQAVFVYKAPNLQVLNISNCANLELINLGFNGGIKALLAKNCNLREGAQESLLSNLRPVKTSSSNVSGLGIFGFKKEAECVLDLRGSEIVWNNRKIASKIRLLLTNNWLVRWDNAPPTSIVPPHFYSFFTNNLEEKLFKEYYG